MLTGVFLDGYMFTITEEDFHGMRSHQQSELAKLGELYEDVACPVCGHEVVDVLVETAEEGALGICQDCGVAYAYRRATLEALRFFYMYYTPSSLTSIEVREQNAKKRPMQINFDIDHIEKHTVRGRLLDVGCASGDFLAYARARGWGVEGTELSGNCIRFVNEVMNIKVHYGHLQEIDFAPSNYDAIALRHSVEHLCDPIGDLKHLGERLTPSGVLLITTPEHAKDPKVLKENHMLPLHVVNYTEKTLEFMLKKAGFKVIEYEPIPAGHFTHNSDLDCMMVVAVKI